VAVFQQLDTESTGAGISQSSFSPAYSILLHVIFAFQFLKLEILVSISHLILRENILRSVLNILAIELCWHTCSCRHEEKKKAKVN